MSMLRLPLVSLTPALPPSATSSLPVLIDSASEPTARLSWPAVLVLSAKKPLATL
jgi:hypothetical protein